MIDKIKIRLHRAGQESSLKTEEIIDNSMSALVDFINRNRGKFSAEVIPSQIRIEDYTLTSPPCDQLYMVRVINWGVVGFCDRIPADYNV